MMGLYSYFLYFAWLFYNEVLRILLDSIFLFNLFPFYSQIKLNDLNIKDLLFRNNKLLYLSFQDNTLSFDSYIKNNDFINLLHYRLIINPNYMNKL